MVMKYIASSKSDRLLLSRPETDESKSFISAARPYLYVVGDSKPVRLKEY